MAGIIPSITKRGFGYPLKPKVNRLCSRQVFAAYKIILWLGKRGAAPGAIRCSSRILHKEYNLKHSRSYPTYIPKTQVD